mgnify:CR=1 FL=1
MEDILDKIPEAAKDIRITYKNISENSSIKNDIDILSYAVALNLKNNILIDNLGKKLTDVQKQAATSAVALMNMTNVYYSYTELIEEIRQMPAGLRMQAYASHGGVDKNTWERLTLIVSIINKCKNCIRSHVENMKKNQEPPEVIKDIGRLAASLHAIHKFV